MGGIIYHYSPSGLGYVFLPESVSIYELGLLKWQLNSWHGCDGNGDKTSSALLGDVWFCFFMSYHLPAQDFDKHKWLKWYILWMDEWKPSWMETFFPF